MRNVDIQFKHAHVPINWSLRRSETAILIIDIRFIPYWFVYRGEGLLTVRINNRMC